MATMRVKRQLIQGEICAEVEEERCSRTVAICQQGAWTSWDHGSTWKITWTEIWKSESTRLKFLIHCLIKSSQAHPIPKSLGDNPNSSVPVVPGKREHILGCYPNAL